MLFISLTMRKIRVWSSAAGFSALIFYLIGVAGAVLQFIDVYLPGLQIYMANPDDNLIYLIAFIVNIAIAFNEATKAGRRAFLAGMRPGADIAEASSPLTGFLGEEKVESRS